MASIGRAAREPEQLAHPSGGHPGAPADPGAATHRAERSATFSEAFADPSHPVDDLLDSTFASRYVSQPMAKDR